MYFQKDEDDEENLSPNLSSEEFKELTDNNDKLNKSQSKVKPNLVYSMEKSNEEETKKMVYSANYNMFNKANPEEKKEYLDLKISSEGENFNIENEHEININEYEANSPSNMSYLDKNKNNKENEIENSKMSLNNNNINDDYNFQVKSISSLNNNVDASKDNMEQKFTPINYVFNENKNINNETKNNYTNNQYEKNNNNINNDINKNYNINNNVHNENNINNNINDNYKEDTNDNKINNNIIKNNNLINKNGEQNDDKIEKQNIEIINKILNDRSVYYTESEISNNYQAFLNEKMNLIQKELSENKENVIQNRGNEKKIEEKPYQQYPQNDNRKKINKEKEPKKINETNYLEKKEKIMIKEEKIIKKENDNNLDNKDFDTQKKNYYFSYDQSLNIHNYTKNMPKEGEYEIHYNTDLKNVNGQGVISTINNNIKEIKDNKKELIESNINKNIYDNKNNNIIKNDNNIYPQKDYNVSNNINNYKDNYKINENINNNYKNINEDVNNNLTKSISSKTNVNIELDNNYSKQLSYSKNVIQEKNTKVNNNNNFLSSRNEQNSINTQRNIEKNLILNKYITPSINIKEESTKTNTTERMVKSSYKTISEKVTYNIHKDNIMFSRNNLEKQNSPKLTDSLNLNTLESITIKKIDEEEEKRFKELEQEEKRLNDLENEKIKLIEEEKEVRQKILEEIERQEKKEREEKKKRMKMRYVESMKKKKEDEEKLRQIKMKQELELKEINELKYKKKLEEEKLLLLIEGKLNRHEIKNYRISMQKEGIQNDNVTHKKTPFDIIRDFDNKVESEREKRKYTNILNENNVVEVDQILKNNRGVFKNKKNLNNPGTKSYQGINNNYLTNDINGNNLDINLDKKNKNQYLSLKDNMISINTTKNKTINSTKNLEKDIITNEYMSFSPTIASKKNTISLSPVNIIDTNNVQTDLDQLISFSPAQNNNNENINDYLNNNQNNIRNIKDDDENSLYEKKMKKNIKRKKNENNKNISYEKKNIKDKLINYDSKQELIRDNNLNDLKQMEEINSKIKNEADNNNNSNTNNEHILYKAKSTSKINPYLKYSNNNIYQNYNTNNYSYTNRNENKYLNEQKDEKIKENNTEQYNKNFIKETNKDLSNSRNNKYLFNKEEKMIKQKSFMEDYVLPKDINKEGLVDLKKDNIENKENKVDTPINYVTASTNDSKYINNRQYGSNKIKKQKIRDSLKNQESNGKIEENKNYNNSGNQKVYYKDYLSASDRSNFNDLNENFLGEQNNSKFLMYYNEIYRDNKK